MRFLAAWFGNPAEYWPQIFGLVFMIAIGVFIIRRFQAKKETKRIQ